MVQTGAGPVTDAPRRCAIISDIHSNLEALQAVLSDIDARGIDRVFCLGDVIGYGPDPEACVDLVMERCEFAIRGNHDEALFSGAERFNPYARAAIAWTRDRLKPGLFRPRLNASRWAFLKDLPIEKRLGDHYFVHGSPRDHVNEYIYREDVFFNAEGKLATIFRSVDRLLFVGHTHLPMVISGAMKSHAPSDDESSFEFGAQKYIVNVGSVGQPRDRDARSCYIELDGDTVHFHRVAYDLERTIAKIARFHQLDPVLGSRLRDGM